MAGNKSPRAPLPIKKTLRPLPSEIRKTVPMPPGIDKTPLQKSEKPVSMNERIPYEDDDPLLKWSIPFTPHPLQEPARKLLSVSDHSSLIGLIRDLFPPPNQERTEEETLKRREAEALYRYCARHYPNALTLKLVHLLECYYGNSYDSRSKTNLLSLLYAFMLSITEMRNQCVVISRMIISEVKASLMFCIRIERTGSDFKILSRIVSLVVQELMELRWQWNSLVEYIKEAINNDYEKGILLFCDLPLTHSDDFFIELLEPAYLAVKQRFFYPHVEIDVWVSAFVAAVNILVRLEHSSRKDFAADIEYIYLKSLEVMVKAGKQSYIEQGLSRLHNFVTETAPYYDFQEHSAIEMLASILKDFKGLGDRGKVEATRITSALNMFSAVPPALTDDENEAQCESDSQSDPGESTAKAATSDNQKTVNSTKLKEIGKLKDSKYFTDDAKALESSQSDIHRYITRLVEDEVSLQLNEEQITRLNDFVAGPQDPLQIGKPGKVAAQRSEIRNPAQIQQDWMLRQTEIVCHRGGEFTVERKGDISYAGGTKFKLWVDVQEMTSLPDFKRRVLPYLDKQEFSFEDVIFMCFAPQGDRRTLIIVNTDFQFNQMLKICNEYDTIDVYILSSIEAGILQSRIAYMDSHIRRESSPDEVSSMQRPVSRSLKIYDQVVGVTKAGESSNLVATDMEIDLSGVTEGAGQSNNSVGTDMETDPTGVAVAAEQSSNAVATDMPVLSEVTKESVGVTEASGESSYPVPTNMQVDHNWSCEHSFVTCHCKGDFQLLPDKTFTYIGGDTYMVMVHNQTSMSNFKEKLAAMLKTNTSEMVFMHFPSRKDRTKLLAILEECQFRRMVNSCLTDGEFEIYGMANDTEVAIVISMFES